MKNYKPKVRYLEEYQVEALKNMGFFSPSIGRREQIDKHTQYLQKYYGMCGGGFKLNIRLNSYFFGDTYCPAYVGLESPYDSWWHKEWSIKEFTGELRSFYEELNSDIRVLVTLGIIEEMNDRNVEMYIIQTFDKEEYYKGDGNMTDNIQEAKFYTNKRLAYDELSEFDIPNDFEIKKIIISLSSVVLLTE